MGQSFCLTESEVLIKPDTTTNYEVGLRSMWLDGRLIVNAAAYYIDWQDIQVLGTSATGGVPITVNGSAAESKGIELTTRWSITDHLELAANVTFNDAKLSEDAPGLVDGVDAFDGDRLAGTPEQQGTLLLAYTRPLDNGLTVTADYTLSAVSDVYTKVGLRDNGEALPGWAVHGLSFGLTDGRWSARALRGQPVRQVRRHVGAPRPELHPSPRHRAGRRRARAAVRVAHVFPEHAASANRRSRVQLSIRSLRPACRRSAARAPGSRRRGCGSGPCARGPRAHPRGLRRRSGRRRGSCAAGAMALPVASAPTKRWRRRGTRLSLLPAVGGYARHHRRRVQPRRRSRAGGRIASSVPSRWTRQRAGIHFNHAASLKFLGRFAEAEAAYEACVRCDPHFWRAHSALAATRRQTPERNHLARLERLLATDPLEPDAELHLRHALAKELEDLGRDDEAFAHLLAGNARKHAATGYRFERDQAPVRRGHASVPRGPAGTCPRGPDGATRIARAPIFVVGMPRTGTTLVERILSSHSQVASAGESQNFGVLLKRACRDAVAAGARRSHAGAVAATSTCRRSGRDYVERTRPPGRAQPRFVDKMPLNFFYLGHIARALPAASIVVLRRHPLDTGLSNFRQLFATGFSVLRLRARPARYRPLLRAVRPAHRALAAHAAGAGARSRGTRRSSPISVPRPRRLLAHCRLPWEEACLHFERNAARGGDGERGAGQAAALLRAASAAGVGSSDTCGP